MDATISYEASFSSPLIHSDINKSSVSVKTSRDSESTVEIIARFELDIAYVCEKLTNLNLLSMHVETMESEFQPYESDVDPDLVLKTVEYDLLSGFLDSETRILETHISDLQTEKDNVREFLSSRKHAGESVTGMEAMLHDSEKSLQQSLEQVLEIKTRSASFEKNLLTLSGEKNHTELLPSSDLLELEEKMKMKTVEHQRHVLRMLEKSLEREIDLEQRASELNQIVETLAMRQQLLEQEVVDAEDEAETTLEKFYHTDHSSELLMQTSKEFITESNILQSSLNGSIQQSSKLEKELCDVKVKLQHAEACCEASDEQKSMLLSTIKDMDDVINDLKKQATLTDKMEDRCIELSESNANLKKELKSVKGKVKSLEKSLHQMEETKKVFGKDINRCSKFITDLAVQMKTERERLQKQISSLKHENKMLVNRLKKTDKDSAVKASHGDKVSAENKEAVSTNFEEEKACVTTARDIDARQIKTKGILLVFIIIIVPLIGAFLYQS